jgi:KDO2-lipid IV(A) lauroyltransferase
MNDPGHLTTPEWLLYRLLNRLLGMLGRIPPSIAKKSGDLLGDMGFVLDKRHRNITLDNIALALGGELNAQQQVALARAVYRNLGQIIFEVGWWMTARPETLNQIIHIDGLEYFQAASERGKGMLFVTAHIGNWELLPYIGSYLQMPVNIVYRPLDFKPLNLVFERSRSRFGAKLIPSRHALLRILKALKKGEAVAMLMDQNVDYSDGVWVDFFGHPACTSKSMAVIAMKTGASVLPVFLYRQATGFRATIGGIIPPSSTGDQTKDIEANTARYTQAIEQAIRQSPDQWFWVHRRWKTKNYSPWPKQ